MTWISIDPAEKTGIAIWSGADLVGVGTMRPADARKAKKAGVVGEAPIAFDYIDCALADIAARRVSYYPSRMSFWTNHIGGKSAVMVEESFGESPKTVAQMGERRGYIERVCDVQREHTAPITYRAINTSEWRKVCGDRLNASWPAKSKDAKQRSIDLAREHYQIEVSGDEGDAIWIGRAALWLGLVKP